jgi:hypothetical protein
MVTVQEVERQLKHIGANFRFWGRAEVKELHHILFPGEQIQGCVNGRYEGGFAMLCATDHRLLLIDKKPMYLTLEDLRYDMVSEVDYSHRLLDATMRVCTFNKALAFTSLRHKELRAMTGYLQQRVMEVRQYGTRPSPAAQVLQQTPEAVPQPLTAFQPALSPSADQAASITRLPVPGFSANPYTQTPVMMRRRVYGYRRDG